MMSTKHWKDSAHFVIAVQLVCLAIMGVVEFLNMTSGFLLPINVHLITNGGIVLSICGLWAITLWKNPRAVLQRDVILGIVMVLWFLVLELNRRINYIPMQSLTIFAVVYLVAMPFAAMTQDQDRQAGIRLISGIYIAAALSLLALGIVLMVGGKLPGALAEQVYWDGARLLILHHSNLVSRILMIAIALCLGFLGQAKKLWVKALLLLATILLFAANALTNCRAVIIVTCVIVAGNVFFLIYNNTCKRFLLSAVAAIAAVIVLITSATALYQWNTERLMKQTNLLAAPEQMVTLNEPKPETPGNEITMPQVVLLSGTSEPKLESNDNSRQETFLTDLPTLNNRTNIWNSFMKKIWREPAILLRGVVDTRLVWGNLHTHNAWLEALIMLGLPGFILVLFFSWNATWASLRLLWYEGAGMFKKNIALLALATMVAALLEPCLFITYTEWSFSDFFFFLCLGYLMLWNRQIPRKK